MLSFKKIGVLSLLLSAGLLLGLAINGNKASQQRVFEAKATDPWQEEIYAANLVIGYGKAVKADSTADYATATSGRYSFFVRHGYLTNNKIHKYDNVTSDGSTNATFTSNTATDATCSHWKFELKSGKLAEGTEDGVILGITAHETMTYSINTMTFKGWPNSGKANTYVQRSGLSSYDLIQSATITNTSTEYSQSEITLYSGDTAYFEFFQADGTGNLQSSGGAGLPTFKMAEAQIERTITTTNIAKDYYNHALATNPSADYARDETQVFDVAVRHGKIEANNVAKFDSVTFTSNNLAYTQSADTDKINAAISYGKNVWSGNDDGVIYVIKALQPITFQSNPKQFNGWQDNVYLTYAIKESGASSYIVVAKEYYHGKTNSGDTQAVNPILLNTGDELYFEFRFPWEVTATNQRRSIQDNSDEGTVPTFVVSRVNIGTVAVEANTFMAKFMKLATVATDNEGTGQCVSAGWYSRAKTAFNAMSADARELFLTDAAYADGAARLIKWATANGEEINASNLLVTASSNHLFINNSKQSTNVVLIVVIAVAISSLAFMGFAFFSRKRKHL